MVMKPCVPCQGREKMNNNLKNKIISDSHKPYEDIKS